MDFSSVIMTQEDGIAIITLNRPKFLNALNEELINELGIAFSALSQDPSVRALVITGGDKCFAAGGDIGSMVTASPLDIYRFVEKIHLVFDQLEQFDRPTIAAINGVALGGGCELSLCCDFRVAGENASFGQPEITIGVIPGGGGTQRLSRLIGASRAKEMIFLGTPIKSTHALVLGLVNRVVPDDQVMDEALKMACELKKKPAAALKLAKQSINRGLNTDVSTGNSFEKVLFSLLFSSDDQTEGMQAFIQRRKPVFSHK